MDSDLRTHPALNPQPDTGTLQLKPALHPDDLVDRVCNTLRDAICSGQLAPGTRLTQDQLADQLKMSRQPVLLAVRMLMGEGLLRPLGRKAGMEVTLVTQSWVAQVASVRQVLIALAAEQAAERKQPFSAAPPDIDPATFHPAAADAWIVDQSANAALLQAAHNTLIHQRRIFALAQQHALARPALHRAWQAGLHELAGHTANLLQAIGAQAHDQIRPLAHHQHQAWMRLVAGGWHEFDV